MKYQQLSTSQKKNIKTYTSRYIYARILPWAFIIEYKGRLRGLPFYIWSAISHIMMVSIGDYRYDWRTLYTPPELAWMQLLLIGFNFITTVLIWINMRKLTYEKYNSKWNNFDEFLERQEEDHRTHMHSIRDLRKFTIRLSIIAGFIILIVAIRTHMNSYM